MPDELTTLLGDLVAIDSVNPSLVPGGAGEREIAAFVAAWGREQGLETEVLEATPGRPSVVLRARGSEEGAPVLALCGHLDTVGVAGMDGPHEPRVDGDRLYGRGAYDMKAGLAAAMLACRDVAARGLAGDVVVAAVADEEHASLGVQEVLAHLEADAAVVTEPTELAVAVAHKGFVWLEAEVTGRAAHGSRPHLGVDAIARAGAILGGIAAWDAALAGEIHPLLGRGSVHASTIEGGIELSSYPPSCRIGLERRTLPGERGVHVEREFEAILRHAREREPELVVTHRTLLVREPFEADPEERVVRELRSAARRVLGHDAEVGGVSFWADSAFFAAAGIPTVLFGPSGDGAHAAEEWVSLDSTRAVAATLVELAASFCA